MLGNGLGRHDAARDAARRAFERDPLGFGPLIIPELAEAAARTGDTELVGTALEWLSERTRIRPTDWAVGIEARIRALLGDGDAAEGPAPCPTAVASPAPCRPPVAAGRGLFTRTSGDAGALLAVRRRRR